MLLSPGYVHLGIVTIIDWKIWHNFLLTVPQGCEISSKRSSSEAATWTFQRWLKVSIRVGQLVVAWKLCWNLLIIPSRQPPSPWKVSLDTAPILGQEQNTDLEWRGAAKRAVKRDVCLGTLNISNYENNMRHTHRPVGLLCFLICALYDSWCLSCRMMGSSCRMLGQLCKE